MRCPGCDAQDTVKAEIELRGRGSVINSSDNGIITVRSQFLDEAEPHIADVYCDECGWTPPTSVRDVDFL